MPISQPCISKLSNPNIYTRHLGRPRRPRNRSGNFLASSDRRPRRQRGSTRALLMRSFPRAPCGSGTCEIPTHKRLAVRNSDPQYPGSLSCSGRLRRNRSNHFRAVCVSVCQLGRARVRQPGFRIPEYVRFAWLPLCNRLASSRLWTLDTHLVHRVGARPIVRVIGA